MARSSFRDTTPGSSFREPLRVTAADRRSYLRRVIGFDIETHFEKSAWEAAVEANPHLKDLSVFAEEARPYHQTIAFASKRFTGEQTKVETLFSSVEQAKQVGREANLEKELIQKLTGNIGRKGVSVGWHSGGFDWPVLAERGGKLGIAGIKGYYEPIGRHVDMMEALKSAITTLFGPEAASRSFALDVVAKDLGLTGKTEGELIGKAGKEGLKSLFSSQEGVTQLREYVGGDVDALFDVNRKTGVVEWALSGDERFLKRGALKTLATSPQYSVSRQAHQFLETLPGLTPEQRSSAFIGVTGESTTGTSAWSRWMKDPALRKKTGLQIGDVNWIFGKAKEVGKRGFTRADEEKDLLGVVVRHAGKVHKFDMRRNVERISYTMLTRSIANEIGDEQYFLDQEKKKLARLKDSKKARAEDWWGTDVGTAQRNLKGEEPLEDLGEDLLSKLKKVVARGRDRRGEALTSGLALGSKELGGPAGLDDHVSNTLSKILSRHSYPLSRVTPYALGIAAGVDVLASRDKAPSVYGALVGGATYLLASGGHPLKRAAIAGGAYILTKMIGGSLRKQHDPPLHGFEEQGQASINRKQLTQFGSGWDALIELAARHKMTLQEFLIRPEVKTRMAKAIETGGELLGEGAEAEVFLHRFFWRKEEVSFVTKRYKMSSSSSAQESANAYIVDLLDRDVRAKTILPREKAVAGIRARIEREALDVLGEAAPTVYGHGVTHDGRYYNMMEYLNPEEFLPLERYFTEKNARLGAASVEKFECAIAGLHSKGLFHGDIAGGNVFIHRRTGDLLAIDPGVNKLAGLEAYMHPFLVSQMHVKTDLLALQELMSLGVQGKGQQLTTKLFQISNSLPLSSNSAEEIRNFDAGIRADFLTEMERGKRIAPQSTPEPVIRGYANSILSSLGVRTETGTLREIISAPPARGIMPRMRDIEQALLEGRLPVEEGQRLIAEAGKQAEVDRLSHVGMAYAEQRGNPKNAIEGLRTSPLLPKVPAGGTAWDPARAFRQLLGHLTDEAFGAWLIKHGKRIGKVGEGGIGSVELMQVEKDGQILKFARKFYSQDFDKAQRKEFLEGEVKGLRALQSTVAPTVYGTGEGEKGSFLLMEYIEDARTLERYAKEVGRPSKDIFAQVRRSIEELHKKGLYWGDLTQNNILIDGKGRVALIDPMSARFEANVANIALTKDPARPFEVIKLQEHSYGVASDLLAFQALEQGFKSSNILNAIANIGKFMRSGQQAREANPFILERVVDKARQINPTAWERLSPSSFSKALTVMSGKHTEVTLRWSRERILRERKADFIKSVEADPDWIPQIARSYLSAEVQVEDIQKLVGQREALHGNATQAMQKSLSQNLARNHTQHAPSQADVVSQVT